MALVFNAIVSRELKVISSKDESLLDVTQEQYDDYLKDLDESKLVFKEGEKPTYFILKTVSSQKEILEQKDAQTSMAMKAQKTGDAPIYSMMAGTVRPALKDMITDGVSQIIKDKSGLASEEFMAWLSQTDIIADLYRALEAAKGVTDVELAKKKSAHL
jgi:hypothetical protein